MKKSIYLIRIILFLIQFYLVFSIIGCILQVGLVGYMFLLLYILYVLKIIMELLSKKTRYQNDFVYNFMQIGLFFYMGVIFIKILSDKLIVIENTKNYFITNYLILSLLLIFISLYSLLELRDSR